MQDNIPEDATRFMHQGRQVEIVLSEATGGRWDWHLVIDGRVHSPGDVGPAPDLAAAILEAQTGARYLIDSGAAGKFAKEA